MADSECRKHKVQLDRFTVLAPFPPFVDVILQCSPIKRHDFEKIVELALGYPDDPRMIEIVRKAGDASAKVPYLMDFGETPQSILEALREVVMPHVESLKKMPEPMQATIHTLLSINMVPTGYEAYGIPALLEINRMQKEITAALRSMMTGRKLAQEFHENNKDALKLLDQEWHNLREHNLPWPFARSLPEHPQMQFNPIYQKKNLVSMRELCVIVDSPDTQELKSLTPRILRRPLPEDEMVPVTGSADWLLRMVGKIGRHFTRALLEIIVKHLEEEKLHTDSQNYDRINFKAQDALRSFTERHP
jgi:hypothetical protein